MEMPTLDLKQKLLETLDTLKEADTGTFDAQGNKVSDTPDGKISLNSPEAEKLFEVLDKDSNDLMNRIRLGEHKIHFSASGARASFYDRIDGNADGHIELSNAEANLLKLDDDSLAKSLMTFIDTAMEKSSAYKDVISGHLKRDFWELTGQLSSIKLALSVFCNHKDNFSGIYSNTLKNEL